MVVDPIDTGICGCMKMVWGPYRTGSLNWFEASEVQLAPSMVMLTPCEGVLICKRSLGALVRSTRTEKEVGLVVVTITFTKFAWSKNVLSLTHGELHGPKGASLTSPPGWASITRTLPGPPAILSHTS